MFPVRYELGFYIPEDGILHSHAVKTPDLTTIDIFWPGLLLLLQPKGIGLSDHSRPDRTCFSCSIGLQTGGSSSRQRLTGGCGAEHVKV
jgi:hypothetical protein